MSKLDIDLLPQIHYMGSCAFDPLQSLQEHDDIYHEMIYIMKGEVDVVFPGKRYHGNPGDVLFIPAGVKHRDEFDFDVGLEVIIILFSWEQEERFLKTVNNDSLKKLPKSKKTKIIKIFEAIKRELTTLADHDDLQIAHSRLLTALLFMRKWTAKASPQSVKRDSTRRKAILIEAQSFLKEHYTEPISLTDVAERLNVSSFYLSRVFSQENNFSLFSYLTSLRMKKAKELLSENKLNVSETAYAVGFNNKSYFSKIFKKYFGKPPSSFYNHNS